MITDKEDMVEAQYVIFFYYFHLCPLSNCKRGDELFVVGYLVVGRYFC